MTGTFEGFYIYLQHKGQLNLSIPSFGEAFEIWGSLSWLHPLLVIGNSLVTCSGNQAEKLLPKAICSI